jgi:hypothetical protein
VTDTAETEKAIPLFLMGSVENNRSGMDEKFHGKSDDIFLSER